VKAGSQKIERKEHGREQRGRNFFSGTFQGWNISSYLFDGTDMTTSVDRKTIFGCTKMGEDHIQN
jgi:hypothetical protein